jgi:hypothetical protein
MKLMYECESEEMVKAGVALRRPESVWLDRDGNVVADEKDAFRCKTDIEPTHP